MLYGADRLQISNECDRCDPLLDQGKYILYLFGTFHDEHLYHMELSDFIIVGLVMYHRPKSSLSSCSSGETYISPPSPWRPNFSRSQLSTCGSLAIKGYRIHQLLVLLVPTHSIILGDSFLLPRPSKMRALKAFSVGCIFKIRWTPLFTSTQPQDGSMSVMAWAISLSVLVSNSTVYPWSLRYIARVLWCWRGCTGSLVSFSPCSFSLVFHGWSFMTCSSPVMALISTISSLPSHLRVTFVAVAIFTSLSS